LRLLKNNKGVVRVIEALFASVLLMSCLALIPAQPNLKNSDANLASTAQNVLLSLDSNGHLSGLIDNRDWQALKSSLESSLPLTIWFNLTVIDQNMNTLNNYPISNAGSISDTITSIDYVCVSQNSDFTVYTLRLQLSVVD
jgi:hypothetical protein